MMRMKIRRLNMKNTPRLSIVIIMVLLCLCSNVLVAKSMEPINLRCEYLVDPLGIDALSPRLSWISESDQRDQKQIAYRLIVASSREALDKNVGDLWDTGKVASDQSIQVKYGGKALESRMQCFWKVQVWDKDGRVSAWSKTAIWSMGLLDDRDWQAKWIGLDSNPSGSHDERPALDDEEAEEARGRELPARYVRREFEIGKKVKRATAYVCGLGFFDLFINGREVENDLMQPGLTRYDRRILYVTHDLTQYLKQGHNAVGLILGNGRFHAPRLTKPAPYVDFGFPRMLFQMHIEYDDGSEETVVSDSSWNISDQGPIRTNNEYDGEIYDARMEVDGWSKPGFNDSVWITADLVLAPGGRLEAQMIEPMRVVQEIKPVSVKPLDKGGYIVDMGQVFYGNVRIKVSGPAGTKISLISAYSLDEDGSLRDRDNRAAKCTDSYTLSGQGEEIWSPRFKGQGFRRVWVTGWPGKPTVDNFTGQVISMDVPEAGNFSCSDILVNQIYSNIRATQRMYLRTVPMDPDRDERQGWIGDQNHNILSYSYSWNIYPFFSKWLGDLRLDQRANGHLPVVTPSFWEFYGKSMLWPSGITLIPELLDQQYADPQAILDNYAVMHKWMVYLERQIDNEGIYPHGDYGDWCDVHQTTGQGRKTPIALLATAYFYRHCVLVEEFAGMQNLSDDARFYQALGERTKTAFNKKFLDPLTAEYQADTQCDYAVAIMLDLVPEAYRDRVIQNFVESIVKDADGHPLVGMVGMQWIFQALDKIGRNDIALDMLQKTTFPSWGYMVSKGATSVWEKWNSDTAGPGMNSEGLLFLGGNINAWLFESIAGLRADPTIPGFKHIIIQPNLVGDLTWAKAHYDCMYGRIVSQWKLDGNKLTMDVTIPANTTATVYIPGRSDSPIEIGSGSYQFHSTIKK
jgi:alpha-L-rhamnosidase